MREAGALLVLHGVFTAGLEVYSSTGYGVGSFVGVDAVQAEQAKLETTQIESEATK